MGESANGSAVPLSEKRSGARRSRRLLILLAAGGAAVVILPLALGLGLGLGLKKHNSSKHLVTPQPETFILNSSAVVGQPSTNRSFDFHISEVTGSPVGGADGSVRSMLVVNGLAPGPTIEVNAGDWVSVNVFNEGANATAIHWHGLPQNGTNYYDGTTGITQCGLPPGKNLTYTFYIPLSWSMTTWFHAHYSTQYSDGITGAFIIHGAADELSYLPGGTPEIEAEVAFVLTDWYNAFSTDLLWRWLSPTGIDDSDPPADEPVPDAAVINGAGQWGGQGTFFNLTVDRDKTYRLRLIAGTTFAPFIFSVDSHVLTVVEADGILVEPVEATHVYIAVAQRYSVLLTANATAEPSGQYWIRAGMDTDMFAYDEPGANNVTLGVLKYSDGSPSAPGPSQDPSVDPGSLSSTAIDLSYTLGNALAPTPPLPAPDATATYPLTFAFQYSQDAQFRAFFNASSFVQVQGSASVFDVADNPGVWANGASTQEEVMGSSLVITQEGVGVMQIVLDNLDDGDHPFHLHGHRPWIVGTGAGRYQGQALNTTNPMRRDTFQIPAYSWIALRFVTDNPGVWAFHCHIAWHMASGLLMQFNIQPSVVASWTFPQAMRDHCAELGGGTVQR